MMLQSEVEAAKNCQKTYEKVTTDVAGKTVVSFPSTVEQAGNTDIKEEGKLNLQQLFSEEIGLAG